MSKLNPEVIKTLLEVSVRENLKAHTSVEYHCSGNNYRISVWKEGAVDGAILKMDAVKFSPWERLVISFQNYCKDLKKFVNTLDADAHITLMLLNDRNPVQSVLVIMDGNVMYDFTKTARVKKVCE